MEHLDPDETMAYIDRLIIINSSTFPDGFVYEGSERVSPQKQFEEVTREYNSRRNANVAKNTLYMIKLQFSFNGVMLFPRYVLLPYVVDGGLCFLNGACYSVSPVLADVGYSVLKGSIFIPFRKTKHTFNKQDYHFFANGKLEITYVIWCMFHNEMRNRKKSDIAGRREIQSCLAHYFFCRYGVSGTFKQWGGADVKFDWLSTVDRKLYPPEQYTVFHSAHLHGKHPTGNLCVIIRNDQLTSFVMQLVGGFFYVVDTFPDRFKELEWIEIEDTWTSLLGRLIYGDYENHGKVLENVDAHLNGSFDKTLDEITKEDLKRQGVKADDIWELLYVIMTDLFVHFYKSTGEEASMYNKRLMILRYVMEELNMAISLLGYGFQGKRDKQWTEADLNDALKRAFKPNTCIKKITKEHGEFSTVSYPGDNKALRITSMLVPQDRAKTNRGHSKGLMTDSSRLLDASIAEVGQFGNQPKTNPDGRARASYYLELEADGTVKRKDHLRDLIDSTQDQF